MSLRDANAGVAVTAITFTFIFGTGKLKLRQAQKKLIKVTEIFFDLLYEDDALLCSSILAPIDEKFSTLWLSHKGRSFDEIYDSLSN